jgi:hypothetical protein
MSGSGIAPNANAAECPLLADFVAEIGEWIASRSI